MLKIQRGENKIDEIYISDDLYVTSRNLYSCFELNLVSTAYFSLLLSIFVHELGHLVLDYLIKLDQSH